jgi:hypothetical protein
MKQRFLPFVLLLTLAALIAPLPAQEPGAVPAADGARVTISAVEQPLGEVLAALSQQIGRPIVLRGGQEQKVRVSGQGIPFSAVMRLLARGYDLVAAWNDGTLYVAQPKADLERLRSDPSPQVAKAFGEVYGPLLRAGTGPYLDATQRQALVSSIEETLRGLVAGGADPALATRLLDAVAETREERLTQVVAEPVLNSRLEAKDWKGAAAIWRRAYPQGAPAEAAGPGWRIAVGLALAGDTNGAQALIQETKLQGDGWQPALSEVISTKPPAETVERVAAAYRIFLKGQPATGAQQDLGRDILAALARVGKADSAEQLWRTAILPVQTPSAATVDATVSLFQALLVAGGPQRARPAWKEWYRWDRLRGEFEVDGMPATDDVRFRRLKRVYGVALALGPAPPELAEHVRKVRFARPKTLRIAALLDRRIQEDAAWKEKTINRIDFASKMFEKTYNMKLEVVDFDFWVPRDETGPNGFVEQLRARKAKTHADFVIGFVLLIIPASLQGVIGKHAQIVGYASPEFGGTMMLRDFSFVDDDGVTFFAPEVVNETAIHEIGHAFGALHTADMKSVMRQGFGPEPAYEFDKYNRRICLFFKEFDFSKGYECFDEGELRELSDAYIDMRGKWKTGNGAEEREAKLRFILARRLAAQRRKGEAIDQFNRVVKIGEPRWIVRQARQELARLQSPAPAARPPARKKAAR